MQQLIRDGGLMNHLARKLGLESSPEEEAK
jgi:hypothetical protein